MEGSCRKEAVVKIGPHALTSGFLESGVPFGGPSPIAGSLTD